VVTLEALPSQVPAASRLRLFLKTALRAWKLRAVSVERQRPDQQGGDQCRA
jgi:hypothetical protein